MALASLAAYGDRLKGGVDEMGISNFVSHLENTIPSRRDLRRAEYGDERDPKMRAFLNQISPLNKIALIRRPFATSIQSRGRPARGIILAREMRLVSTRRHRPRTRCRSRR